MYIILAALSDEISDLVNSEKDHIVISGIGKLNALLSLSNAYYARVEKISAVINLGTVGSQRHPAGSLVEVVKCFQRDTEFFSEVIPLNSYTSLPKANCASSDRLEAFSESTPWDVVDMELYSLALFCKEKAIPLVSIKYVTDRNDLNVYREWRKQLPQASIRISQFWIQQKDLILAQLQKK